MAVEARYRMYALWRAQILGMFAVLGVVAVALIAASIAGSGPPVAFAIFWAAAVVWNGYWFLFRVIYELEIADGYLRWRTPLRSGTENLSDSSSCAHLGWARMSR